MGKMAVLAFLVVGGCSAEGLPTTVDPMAIVWEQTYGMEREARPVVAWQQACSISDVPDGNRAVSISRGCTIAVVHASGSIDLQSEDKISDSAFVLALEEWKAYLIATDFSAVNGAEMAIAKRALIDAGL